MKKLFSSIVILSLAISNISYANNTAKDTLDLAVKYYKQQDYKKAADLFTKVAEQGDMVAQSNLAMMYAEGTGVTQDNAQAFKWYQKSAQQGYATAQFQIGLFYFVGKEVKQDYNKALEWLKKAAEQKNTDAEYYLGAMYHYGLGVEKDHQLAATWYKKAVANGHEEAQKELKKITDTTSENVSFEVALKHYEKQDYQTAFTSFKKLAEQGDAKAQLKLAIMYEKGQGVKKNNEEAIEWYKKSAVRGIKQAEDNLAKLHQKEGRRLYQEAMNELEKNNKQLYEKYCEWGCYNDKFIDALKAEQFTPKIINLLKKGAYLPSGLYSLRAKKSLYKIYMKKKNYSEAIQWLKNIDASYRNTELRKIYDNRKEYGLSDNYILRFAEKYDAYEFLGEVKLQQGNYAEAFEWYDKGCLFSKSIDSCNKVGDLYYDGKGTTQSYTMAKLSYKAVLKKDSENSYAINKMYVMHKKGQGVRKDANETYKWAKKAAKVGNKEALDDIIFYANKGIEDAQFYLGLFYSDKYNQHIKQDYIQSVKWFTKAVEQGSSAAAFNVALKYKKGGFGIKQDYIQAIKWFTKAAELGDTDAPYSISSIYEIGGYGIKQNTTEAIKWYQKAIEQKAKKLTPAELFEKGKDSLFSGNSNILRANVWFEKFVATGEPNAYSKIAKVLFYSQYIKYSEKWITKGIKKGEAESMYLMANLYYTGINGIKQKSRKKGKYWMKKAAKNGYKEARRIVKQGLSKYFISMSIDKNGFVTLAHN